MKHLIYREVDRTNYDEVHQFILRHEYTFRDSLANYIPSSPEELEASTRRLIKNLSDGSERFYCLAVFDTAEMIGMHYLHRFQINHIDSCHVHGLW
ncbi:MAG: hypothetical protein AAF485_20450, partial [Chloroflexota bacterium]